MAELRDGDVETAPLTTSKAKAPNGVFAGADQIGSHVLGPGQGFRVTVMFSPTAAGAPGRSGQPDTPSAMGGIHEDRSLSGRLHDCDTQSGCSVGEDTERGRPMPVPVPATDAQLRHLADTGGQAWHDSTLRSFDSRYLAAGAAPALLTGVPTGPRLSFWTGLLTQFAQGLRHQYEDVLVQHIKPVSDQAFAMLQAANPRPTDQDLATLATADKLVSDAIAATAAEQEAAAALGAVDQRIRQFAGNAATLEQLRTSLEAQLAPLRTALAENTARAQHISSLINAFPRRDELRTAVGSAVWTAQTLAADKLQLMTRSGDEADHALRSAINQTLADQEAAITSAYQAPVAVAQAASTRLVNELAALAESAIVFFCTPPPPPPVVVDPAFAGGQFVDVFTEGMQAYLALPQNAINTFHMFWQDVVNIGMRVMFSIQTRIPMDTPAQTLVDLITFIADYQTPDPDPIRRYGELVSQVFLWADTQGIPERTTSA
jgi:TolA-binding protein